MEDGTTFARFSFLSSLLPFFVSRPGTNGVGSGFYHLQLMVEFPGAPDPPKCHDCAVPIASWTYDFVHVRTQHDCIILSSLCFPFCWHGIWPGGFCGVWPKARA